MFVFEHTVVVLFAHDCQKDAVEEKEDQQEWSDKYDRHCLVDRPNDPEVVSKSFANEHLETGHGGPGELLKIYISLPKGQQPDYYKAEKED